MSYVRIEQWSVDWHGGAHDPPELWSLHLVGIVYGHPTKADETRIITSPIKSTKGRLVTTDSETVYELGEPSPAYLAWLREGGIVLDPKEPVKVGRRGGMTDRLALTIPEAADRLGFSEQHLNGTWT